MVAPVTGRVLKCDLCDGDPICVKVCPTGALNYEPETLDTYTKVVNNAARLSELVQTVVIGNGGRGSCTAGPETYLR